MTEIDDKDLPEWYLMTKDFFREIAVFSQEMYAEMSGAQLLAQIRQVAVRDKKRIDEEDRASRAAEQRTGAEQDRGKKQENVLLCKSCRSIVTLAHGTKLPCSDCGDTAWALCTLVYIE